MKLPNHKQSPPVLPIVVSGMVFVLHFGTILFFRNGGGLIKKADTIVNVAILLFATFLSFRLRMKTPNKREGNGIWLFLGIGMLSDALAEVFWLVYLLVGIEPPHVGPGDVIFFIAYTCLVIALINIFRLYSTVPVRRRWVVFTVLNVVILIIIAMLVMHPIASSTAASNPVEIVVYSFFPLADFFIFEIATFLLFSLWDRRISTAWKLIIVGSQIFALVDLVFIYADWNALYYPGNQINLISEIIDLGAMIFALLFIWAILTHNQLLDSTGETMKSFPGSSIRKQRSEPPPALSERPIEQGVFFTDKDNNLIYFSDTLRDFLVKLGSKPLQIGQSLLTVLGMDKNGLNKIIKNAPLKQKIDLQINKKPIPFMLVATARLKGKKDYGGMDLYLTHDKNGIIPLLNEDPSFVETGHHILMDTWAKIFYFGAPKPDNKKILAYLFSKTITLYIFTARLRGLTVAQGIHDVFNASAQKAAVACRFDESSIQYDLLPDVYKVQSLVNDVIRYSEGLVPKGFIEAFQDYFDQTIPVDVLDLVKESLQEILW